ncbi:TPA: DUF3379 domain-containing protein [Vibrio vulnificus]|nr:DUF3379 family protein [Vibrio vulnificus]
MDDLEFRRRILSDPKSRDEDVLQALNSSDSNAKFAEDVLDLDAQIKQAMKVDVPEELVDKILFKQTSYASDDKIVRPNFVRKAMALAASFAFTAGLLVGQINWGNLIVLPAQASLADTAMKHVVAESGFVRHIDEQVTSVQINAKLSPLEYYFDANFPYHVYYLNHCGFGHANALHMIFQGDKGKITLFIAPIKSPAEADFAKDGMNGIIVPIGDTSLILVGENGEDTKKFAEKLAPMIKPLV